MPYLVLEQIAQAVDVDWELIIAWAFGMAVYGFLRAMFQMK